jgi:hypothetical protein
VFAKCILALSRLRNKCYAKVMKIFIALKPRAQISEGIPRSLLLSGKIPPALCSRKLKNCQTSTGVLLRVGAGAVVLYLVFTADLSWGKNPVCANALTQSEEARACRRAHSGMQPTVCVCAVAQSRHPLWPRTVCTLFPSESRVA